MDFFKILDKYGKEFRCSETWGKYYVYRTYRTTGPLRLEALDARNVSETAELCVILAREWKKKAPWIWVQLFLSNKIQVFIPFSVIYLPCILGPCHSCPKIEIKNLKGFIKFLHMQQCSLRSCIMPPSTGSVVFDFKSNQNGLSDPKGIKNIICTMVMSIFIATDKRGYPHNIFLISRRIHMLWVLIRSASPRRF